MPDEGRQASSAATSWLTRRSARTQAALITFGGLALIYGLAALIVWWPL